MDQELLADFLTEAGDMVDALGEQIVAFEQSDADPEQLNALFRVFHTMKGSAGFLEIQPMVDLCHAAEELMGAVRTGALDISPEIIDGISQSVTWLDNALAELSNGEAITPADPALIASLEAACRGESPAATEPQAQLAPERAVDVDAILGEETGEPISDDDFEALRDAFHGPETAATGRADREVDVDAILGEETGEPISDDDFEALLDAFHGPEPAAPAAKAEAPPVTQAATPPTAAPPPTARPADAAPKKARVETSIRIDTDRLDAVVNQVGELVLVRNRLKRLRETVDDPLLDRTLGHLDQVTTGLQSSVMLMRMQPVRKVFSKIPKIVRDLSRTLNKKIEVVLEGEDTELDRTLVESLSEPLVHLVRNAVDHGIEMPAKRLEARKSECGRLTLAAQQVGDHIHIEIRDDGAGIDPSVIRAKAIEKGVIDRESAARLDGQECLDLIFRPGFSTRDAVSEVSGRGVGMDVVRSKIIELNGSVEITSEVGEGSAFLIRLPLTLAILPALMVTVSGREFAIPVTAIEDVSRFDSSRVECMGSREVLRREEDVIALIRMEHWVGRASTAEQQHCVVVDVGRERRALLVDDVPGREEIVVKPLGKMMGGLAGIAGASVTGDGGIALVLDLPGLLNQVSPAYSVARSAPPPMPAAEVAAASDDDMDLELF